MPSEGATHANTKAGIETDDDGWHYFTCSCGTRFGPYPDTETTIDIAMEHANERGRQGE